MKTKVRPHSGVIAATINTPQGPRSFSTGSKDPATAQAILKAANLKAVEVAAKAGALSQTIIQKLTLNGSLTVDQCYEQWREWLVSTADSDRTSEAYLLWVAKWVRDMKLKTAKIAAIRERHLSDWINAEADTKISTRKVMLAALRSLFTFASIRQYIGVDPSRLVGIKARLLDHEQKESRVKECFKAKEYNQVIEYLEDALFVISGKPSREVLKMEDKLAELSTSANPDEAKIDEIAASRAYYIKRIKTIRTRISEDDLRFWLCATIIGRYSGLRLGDICSLEWSCLAKPGKLIVHTDKKNVRVELPIGKELADGIALIPANNRKLCFPIQDATMRHPTQRAKLSMQFGRILKAAGVNGHSFHDLRHTLATELDANGGTLEAIARALGHGSKESTETYIHRK